MAGDLSPDPKPVDTLADFPHEVAKDAPVALPDVLPGEDSFLAERMVSVDNLIPGNVFTLTLEREVSPDVWEMVIRGTSAPGQTVPGHLAKYLRKGGNYRFIAHSKEPVTGTLIDPPPPKPIEPPKLASAEGVESVDPVEAEKEKVA